MKSDGLNVFLNSFCHPYSLCKYDLLEENNPSYILWNLLYMSIIFIFTIHLLL
jgi:hypothetical protein